MHDVFVSVLALVAVGLWGALRLQSCRGCGVPLPISPAVIQLIVGEWACGSCRRERAAADAIREPFHRARPAAPGRVEPELIRRHEEIRAKLAAFAAVPPARIRLATPGCGNPVLYPMS